MIDITYTRRVSGTVYEQPAWWIRSVHQCPKGHRVHDTTSCDSCVWVDGPYPTWQAAADREAAFAARLWASSYVR